MRAKALLRTVLAVAYLSILTLMVWSRTLSPWLVLASALLIGVAVGLEVRRARRWGGEPTMPVALAALGLALLASMTATLRLERGVRNWADVTESREARLSARLEDRLEGVVRRAMAAAYLAADPGEEATFAALEGIQQRTGVDAVALVDGAGRPVAWAGEHRGRLPAEVLARESGIVYPGGTLFAYLYAITPAGSGLRAVSAVLVQTGPPVRGRTNAVSERFEAVTGERVRFSPGTDPDADWTLRVEGTPILFARFPPLTQAQWQARVAGTGRQVVFGLVLLALALLAAGWLRSLDDRSGLGGMVPMGALSVVLMVAPLRRTLGLEQLFSPGFFVLPIPGAGDFVIEGVMVVLLPLAALLSTIRPARVRPSDLWLRLVVGGALVGGGFAVGAGIMARSAGLPMLTSGGPLWYVLQPTTVVLLSVLAALMMPRVSKPDDRGRVVLYGTAGLIVSGGLAVAVATTWRPGQPVPTPLLLAWSVPFVLGARAVAGYVGRGDRLLRWLVAGWLAATAVIPHLWVTSQAARLEGAEAEVLSFGARGDPYLAYLLFRFGEELDRAEERGDHGVDLLYEAWVESGLAGQPYPLELTLWGPELEREAHLPLGVRLDAGSAGEQEVEKTVRSAVTQDQLENVPAETQGVSRILAVPLAAGQAVSVAVAPRVTLRPSSALTAFLEGERQEPLELELLPVEGTGAGAGGDMAWEKRGDAWRSETTVREGPDLYHAHLTLRLPPQGVRFARGMLLITLDLWLLTLLWLAGRIARGDPPVPPGGWLGWLSGFRARLIVALFAFFLLPTAVFGWAAYRALSEEVMRAARQVAERAVVHAAAVLPQAGLVEAARRTGEDLLYYEHGTLAASSVPEAVALGLYSAWMPPHLYAMMRAGEALGGTERGELAERSYLVAYRDLDTAAEVVAVPVWFAARDVAVRQREFAHLVLFGTLVGAVLSLALSVLVGRALAKPIGELRRAAAAVGRGHLRVRLPEQRADEFGELFASFNRMSRHLRRARAQEVRTARILAWGEMARQVAHEIKNPLTPIKLSVQHIRRAYRDGRSDYERILESNVEQILVEIERLTEIARAFSRYGAPQEVAGSTEPVDVAGIARDVLTLYRAPDRAVRYRLTVETGNTVAAARASELREVLVNLLENARAAVRDAGMVDVRVAPDARGVRVEVRDNGEGIPEAQLAHIFDPHFSTRSSGTGLGLAIVRRLVESWGGQVGAESQPGEGAVVWFTVPGMTTPDPTSEPGVDPG